MKMYLSSASFYNRAPFEALQLSFEENEIAVLTAANGRGKTAVLSHIVDAFHEMARPFFPGAYEGKEQKLYRVSSGLDNLDAAKPSLVYLRFMTSAGKHIDYVNVRGAYTEAEYNALGLPDNKIPFHELRQSLTEEKFAKRISTNFDKKSAVSIFEANVLTYFPSYRYESPGYLNDPYRIQLSFAKDQWFSGNLRNPIEVVTGLPQLANWIMDLTLDVRAESQSQSLAQALVPVLAIVQSHLEQAKVGQISAQQAQELVLELGQALRRTFEQAHGSQVQAAWNILNTVLSLTLLSKVAKPSRFGIGPRGLGAVRVQVVTTEIDSKPVYPTIFNMSSGEAAMLCLFGEIIRQADNIGIANATTSIVGIVIIDEIDKHLHIKLQKEILPQLLGLFPNLQFIVSSHAPFLTMGLADALPQRTKIVDLDAFGISEDPTRVEMYAEVYQMMVSENDRFREAYLALKERLADGEIPLIITEGKTDIQHLKTAMARLDIKDCQLEFLDVDGDWGDSKLSKLLDQLSKVPHTRCIIGIFDRDVPSVVAAIENEGRTFRSHGNNVFSFCLPIPHGRGQYQNISIEFFYKDSDLKTVKNGRRLFFDNEVRFNQSAARRNERTLVRLDEPIALDDATKKVFDDDIGGQDWIHSKSAFAELVQHDPEFSRDFDFSAFNLIFARLREVLAATSERVV